MAFTLIGSVKAEEGTLPTPSLDTTGADLIILAVGYYGSSGAPTPSDSKGNTWTGLTLRTESGLSAVRLYYCAAPTVGTGHTFNLSGGSYRSLTVLAFSGAHATPYEAESGASNGTAGTATPGSITPSESGCLFVSANASFYASGFGVSSPFSIAQTTGSGVCTVSIAYEIQTTATARNPSWSYTGAYGWSCVAAVFKSAGGGGGGVKVFIPAFCRGGNG